MAFMVPLVKNHYDIYARNNPADHHNNGNNGGTNTGITGKSGNLVHDPASNSLILSATSLGKSGAPVKKQYRIILSGGQVVTNGNNGGKKKVPGGAGANFVTANGKAYYRMPSASISLPVNGRGPRIGGPGAPRRSSKSTSEAGGAGSVRSTPTSPEHRSNSSNSSPGSPPHYPSSRPPHSSASASICQQPTSGSFRRTSAGVRSPQSGNRLYSYSVSIPEDEEKKVKESLNSLLADKENLDQESQLEDDQLLAIFATSAPGGTGALEEASLVKPPPSLKLMKKKMITKKPLVQKSASLNAASPPPLVEAKTLHHHHSISPSSPPASPTSSPPASPSPSPSPPPPPITTTSREYVELLRKFILHLKMLKIGSSNNNNNNSSSKQRKQSKKSSVKSVKSNGVDKEESELSAVAAAVDDSVVDAAEVGSSEVSSEDSTSAPKRARKRKDTMEDSKDL